jgi:hypothetical protein
MLNDKINMNPSSLVNKKIKIGISDPWEFQDEVGHSEFTGDIKQVFIAHRAFESGEDVSETILIQLEQPFGFKKMKCEYILGSPRHEGKGIEELMKESIPFNFVRIPSDQGQSDNPFDNHQWHDSKGFSLIGTIELI